MVSIRLSVGIVACVLSAIVCMLAWQRARHQATEGESYCDGGICMRSTEGSNTWNSLCSPTHRKNASCEILVYWHDSSLRKHNKRRHPSNKFLGLKLLPSPQALASVTMHIPRRIAQTGPPKRKTWATGLQKHLDHGRNNILHGLTGSGTMTGIGLLIIRTSSLLSSGTFHILHPPGGSCARE